MLDHFRESKNRLKTVLKSLKGKDNLVNSIMERNINYKKVKSVKNFNLTTKNGLYVVYVIKLHKLYFFTKE